MKCVYHNDREAEYICSSCGQPICRECTVGINGRNHCKACAGKAPQYNAQYQRQYGKGDGISGFLFFMFLAVPGLRHMYLGLMKRGMEFMAAFFILIGFAGFINGIEALAIPAVFIIWFYSAFDSYQMRKLVARGEHVEDESIFDQYGLDSLRRYFGRSKGLAGVVIIILGVYLFMRQIARNSYMFQMPQFVRDMMEFAFDSIVPVLFIIGGLYLIRRGKVVKEADKLEPEYSIDKENL